jgi:hypothetical protein
LSHSPAQIEGGRTGSGGPGYCKSPANDDGALGRVVRGGGGVWMRSEVGTAGIC